MSIKAKSISARVSTLAHDNLMAEVAKDERNSIGYVLNKMLEDMAGKGPDSLPVKPRKAIKNGPGSNRKRAWPDDFILDNTMHRHAVKYWSDKGRSDLSPEAEFIKFQSYSMANGKKYVSWVAAWQTWYTNAVQYNKAPGGGHNGKVRLSDGERIAAQATLAQRAQANNEREIGGTLLDEDGAVISSDVGF